MKNFNVTSTTFPSILGNTMYKTKNSFGKTENNFNLINNYNQNDILISSNSFRSNLSKTFYNPSNNNDKNKLKNLIKTRPLSPDSLALSKAETDDTLFAMNEINIVDFKIKKRKREKQKIWHIKNDNNIYGGNASKNRKRLNDIHEKVLKSGGWNKFDLKSEISKKKYFSLDKIDTMFKAEKIMKEIFIQKENSQKAFENFSNNNKIDLFTFTNQNREIFINNILINLLKSEREKINSKAESVAKALNSATKDFIKDFNAFNDFTEKKKNQYKEIEFKLGETIHHNKLLNERLKSLNQDLHSTLEEIEKTIRGILQYKKYADFLHSVLGKDEEMSNVKIDDIDLQKKEKDFEKIVSKIILEFHFLCDEDDYSPNILKNPEMLNNLYFQSERSILNFIQIKEDTLNELYDEKLNNEKQINELEKKIKEHTKEFNEIKEDLKLEELTFIPPENYHQDEIDMNSQFILSLYESICQKDLNEREIKKPINEIIRNTLFNIGNKEKLVINLIEEMDKIQNDENKENNEIFRKIIEKKKNENKMLKWKEGRGMMRKLEDEKNLKYLQRQNRYKIHGPIVYPPPWVLKNKKKKKGQSDKDKINEKEMLYYY